jgi:preprotein translocase subunit YajC
MLPFISQAHAQAQGAAQPPANAELFNIALLIGLFVFFYFIAIRPQRKRQKEHAEMLSALAKGDEVVTVSGILGKVIRIEDDFVVLQVTDNVELKFQRAAISAVVPKGTLKSI